MESYSIQYGLFMVDEKPYCFWDYDLKKVNLEFLDNFDPNYFSFLADVNFAEFQNEDKVISNYASLAIRSAFSQGLETLFSFICAAIQAPHCFPAWMSLYHNSDLKSLVSKIHDYKPYHSFPKISHLGWQSISETIFRNLSLENKEKEEKIKQEYGHLWSKLSSIFLDEGFDDEYNSIKHGFRVKPGGFHLSIGAEDQPGTPAPKERMQLIGKSDYGTSFYEFNPIGKEKWHVSLKNFRNWSPEDMCWGLQLISISLSNVISYVRVFNAINAEKVKFEWPSDFGSFTEPWKRTLGIGVTAMRGFGYEIPYQIIEPFPKANIKKRYNDGKIFGIKQISTVSTGTNDSDPT